MFQPTFASFTPKKKNQLRAEQFLSEMKRIVPWKKIAKLIKPFYYSNKTGRPSYDLILMIKVHSLQQWYNLGDLAIEEAIYDRRSFAQFLGIDLMSHPIPDETTILKFRHLLEEHKLTLKIFRLINRHLEEKGLIMKEGTIVDASIINSPSSTKNKDQKRDPEMSSTRKNGQWYFGAKVHIGTDMKSGLVHHVEFTTAKTADIDMMPSLLHGEEKAIFGDKAYMKTEKKAEARKQDVYWGVGDRASVRGLKLKGKSRQGKARLSQSQKKRNHQHSRVRAKVEFSFRVIKHLWGHSKTRYKGLQKNASQMYLLFGLSNLYQSRKKLLSGV